MKATTDTANTPRGNILYTLVKSYPSQSGRIVVALLFAGLSEGLGVASLLPLLNMLESASSTNNSFIATAVADALSYVNLKPTLSVLLGIVFSGIMLKAAFTLLAMRQVGYTMAQVATDLRLALIRNLLKAKWGFYVKQPVGIFSNAISMEAHRAAACFSSACMILANFIQISIYLSLAFMLSWEMTALAAVASVFIIYSLKWLHGMARKAGARQTELLKSIQIKLMDGLSGIKPLKAMAREEHLGPLLKKETEELNTAVRQQVFSSNLVNTLQEPYAVLFMIVLIYVSRTYYSIPMSHLMVLVFIFYRTVSRIGVTNTYYQGMVVHESAYWSLSDTIKFTESEMESLTGTKKADICGGISFKEVDFSYGNKVILEKASFSIPPMNITSIIGPSGIGKTSVLDMIVGLIEPLSGDILVDGISLREIDMTYWRSGIGYVPQEMILFHDSVYVNVSLGDSSVSRSDVEEALRISGAWEFVSGLPDGMDSVVGERGSKISGGQRQRISIARALVRKPKLLVLDEVTTALDPVTEREICERIKLLKQSMTVLVISHQPALAAIADVVYKLSDGKAINIEKAVH